MKSHSVLMAQMTAALVGLGVCLSLCAQSPAPSPGEAALAAAAQKQQYLFLLFWKEDTPQMRAMAGTLQTALAGRANQATWIALQTTNPAEKAVVDRFGVSRSPMPLVLAVAPNGAITGGFPLKLSEQDVAGAFVSPATAACLKATQARKLVLLCVQPAGSPALPGTGGCLAVTWPYAPPHLGIGSIEEVLATFSGELADRHPPTGPTTDAAGVDHPGKEGVRLLTWGDPYLAAWLEAVRGEQLTDADYAGAGTSPGSNPLR